VNARSTAPRSVPAGVANLARINFILRVDHEWSEVAHMTLSSSKAN